MKRSTTPSSASVQRTATRIKRFAALGAATVLCSWTDNNVAFFSSALACDSKAPLLSTGLQNLGNTCYMNSQLQCAFHIPAVRQIATSDVQHRDDDVLAEDDESSSAVQEQQPVSEASLALKELFEAMAKASEKGSAYLPRSFCARLGIPPMVQQDSQEFWKLLLPAVGSETLSDLYKGVYEDYITALDGSGREKRRDEIFLDLSLDVSKSTDLLESLRQSFGEPELLSVAEGNGWRPEKGAEKVDAHKGSSLVAKGLPTILQFHLKRFNYNWQTDVTTKLNNRFTFPQSLDLSSVCSGMKDGEDDLVIYDLQGVVIHVGEYGAGHYYAYVRPDMRSDQWYRFNDDKVDKVSFQDVVDDAYGGKVDGTANLSSDGKEKHGMLRRIRRLWNKEGPSYGWGGKTSNAYVVQYVRRRDIPMLYNMPAKQL